MESLSRPPHRRKHSTSTNLSSSSFSLKNPYDGVSLSRGDKAKFEPREYAEIFSGSSSIPVLNLSGLSEPARTAGCRSSELDYSNIFGGARDVDVAVSYEQLFKKTRTRMPTETEQEHGSLSSLGKAKRSLGANGVSTDGIKQQLNMSFNKTSQRSSNESDGTHIAQLHAVPGFAHFVDGTPQPKKKEGDGSVPSMKREVSRTWSFQNGIDATMLNGGLSPEKSHALDNSCNVNGINLKSHISKVRPPSGRPSGSNDNKDIKQSSLPSFASKETSGENSPPLFDEELDENSDAAVSIAALKKAIEQAQESIRLAKMIMQKRREGIKDGSRARRSKGLSKIEVKKENKTEHASGGMKENNVMEKNRQLDPKFPMFTAVDAKSAPTLIHSDKSLNARNSGKETVRENFEAANHHGDTFIEVEKKFALSCNRTESLNTDKKVEVGNVLQNFGASKPLGDRAGSLETVVLASGKVDCNDNLICSRTKAVPCLEHMETNQETLEQREPTMHQPEEPEVISGGEKSVTTSQSVLELEQSPNGEAMELLERVLSVSVSTQEQERNTHEGGDLRINQKDEQKFVGQEELYVADFCTLQNESLSLADKNIMDQADINEQPENGSESKEDSQDGKCSNEDENGMVPKEEILWFESELQLEEPVEEEISEREPGIFPGGGEAATKVEPEMNDEKLNFELENDSKTVPGGHEDNETAIRCMDAAGCEAVETIQIGINSDSEVQNGGIPLGVEELNGTDGAAGRRKKLEDDVEELNDSASGKGSGEAFTVHSNVPCTIFRDNHGINTRTIRSENPEPSVGLINAEKYGLSLKAYRSLAVQCYLAGKKFEPELNKMKFTEIQLNNTFERLSLVSKSTSVVFTNANHKKVLPNEDMFRTTTEIHNTAEEYAAKTNMQNCPELQVSTNTTQVKRCDDTNIKPDLQQNLENSEKSQSSSTLESIDDEVSVHESPASRDDATDISSDKEEVKDDLDMNSDERVHAGKQSECLNYEGQTREMDKSVEAERDLKAGLNMEKLLQKLRVTSTSEHQDAKGIEQKNEISDRLMRQACEAINMGREREKARTSTSEHQDAKGIEQKNEISDRLMREACEAINRGREREKARTSTSEHQDAKGIEQKNEVSDRLMREACEAINRGREREKARTSTSEHQDAKGIEQKNEVSDRLMREACEAINRGREREKARTSTSEHQDAKGIEQKNEVSDRLMREACEAIKRGREREKDRIAVDRVIREARERAFAEARERAERAAVERAVAEARQKVEVREKTVKASVETKPSADKASIEAKLRAERAAVERATAEARERALEKAMSQKTSMGARVQATKYSTERPSSSSTNNGLKHNFSSSDTDKFDGANSESAQRRKARLERHQRIMERAAKALAEKNMRDLLAQKEQAERSRLAEYLDADIKRWATGKEGNLRALLSTLQYVLGSDSGWKPLTLTEIVTTAAVKKAYRKATLCVHPDKVQQRGASIQQKYICEKIFDLLKAAWNRFNSEEN